MREEDRIACIALTQVPGIGSITARHLVARYPQVADLFKAPAGKLMQVENVGPVLAKALVAHRSKLAEAEAIYLRCISRKIGVMVSSDEDYPYRLKQIPDAPLVLYTAGEAPHQSERIVSVVGTRKSTAYGKRMTLEIVEQLAPAGVTVVSGLAFGIDTYAHKASIQAGLPTFAVLATPLDKVYPAQNRELAIEIFKKGRLYSEYAPGSKIDARNFPMRNRIIAGLADATLVVEAGETGGALITANLAFDYDRAVFAVPGRVGDEASAGCLHLLEAQKARVYTTIEAFLQEMNWDAGAKPTPKKRALPEHLSDEERKLMLALDASGGIHIDDLSFQTGYGLNVLAGMLLTLEFQGLVTSLPGKKFRVADPRS